MYLSKKSQVLIWWGNFHLSTSVFLHFTDLIAHRGNLRFIWVRIHLWFSSFTAEKYVQLFPLFQKGWLVGSSLTSPPGVFLILFFFFLKGSYFWSLGVIMNKKLWMQFSSDPRVESWVHLQYEQESDLVLVRGLAVALEISLLFPSLQSWAVLPVHFLYKSK